MTRMRSWRSFPMLVIWRKWSLLVWLRSGRFRLLSRLHSLLLDVTVLSDSYAVALLEKVLLLFWVLCSNGYTLIRRVIFGGYYCGSF
ncbi:MAG: hypothetical protein [Microviridae sp.]|nr:MAG: hypothetical protein [Microviridae sp.]